MPQKISIRSLQDALRIAGYPMDQVCEGTVSERPKFSDLLIDKKDKK